MASKSGTKTETSSRSHGLGRITPPDWRHVEKYPMRLAAQAPDFVQNVIPQPFSRRLYDQGSQGSCVGWSVSSTASCVNMIQANLERGPRYDAVELWRRAKEIDEWDWTNPDDDHGTSIRAAFDIMVKRGPRRFMRGDRLEPELIHGFQAYRWAHNIDDIRAAISMNIPVVVGMIWFSRFDNPRQDSSRTWWIGKSKSDLGREEGGHAIRLDGADDNKQAFRFTNSWGMDYPIAWMTYELFGHLLLDGLGEAGIITDR